MAELSLSNPKVFPAVLEGALFWAALAVLFVRPAFLGFDLGPLHVGLTSAKGLLIAFAAVSAVRLLAGMKSLPRPEKPGASGAAALVFWGAAALSAGLSPASAVSLRALWVVFVYAAFYFFARRRLENGAERARVFAALIACSAAVASSDLVFRFFVASPDGADIIERYPFWPGKNMLGLFMAMSALLAASFAAHSGTPVRLRGACAAALVPVAAALVFSYSRAAWLAFGAGALFLLSYGRGRRGLLQAGALALAFVAALGSCVLLFPESALSKRVLSSVPGKDKGVRERTWLWRGAVAMIRDHPITGVGPGRFDTAYKHGGYQPRQSRYDWGNTRFHAHNLYLQLAAEFGLPAALALLSWLALTALRGAFSGPGLRAAGAALAAYAVYSLFDSAFNARFTHASMFHVNAVVLLLLASVSAAARAGLSGGKR